MKAALAGVMVLAFASAALAQQGVAEPGDYRTDNYRSAVPVTLTGARVLTTEQTEAIWRAKTGIFVDVLPRVPKPSNLPAGTVWRDRPRQNIPGSIWLPDTGYGALAPVMQDYFERGLQQATGGDRGRMIVFYCLANCWMSWNAAKRAIALGYARVAWYPAGTDGWAEQHLPLEARTPVARPQAAE